MRRVTCSALIVAALAVGAPPAQAGTPVTIPASLWEGNGVLSAQIPSVGKVPVFGLVRAAFGPLPGLLAADEFELSFATPGETFVLSGIYSIDAKGRPVLAPDLVALDAETAELLLFVCEQFLFPGTPGECEFLAGVEFVFDPSKLKIKLKGKNKQGVESLNVNGKVPFEVTIPEEKPVKVKLSLKGEGPLERLPVAP